MSSVFLARSSCKWFLQSLARVGSFSQCATPNISTHSNELCCIEIMIYDHEIHDLNLHEKMLNITHYQRNAMRYHFMPVRMAMIQKSTSNKCLERVWRKGNPLTLLVGMQTSTANMENSVEIP